MNMSLYHSFCFHGRLKDKAACDRITSKVTRVSSLRLILTYILHLVANVHECNFAPLKKCPSFNIQSDIEGVQRKLFNVFYFCNST